MENAEQHRFVFPKAFHIRQVQEVRSKYHHRRVYQRRKSGREGRGEQNGDKLVETHQRDAWLESSLWNASLQLYLLSFRAIDLKFANVIMN